MVHIEFIILHEHSCCVVGLLRVLPCFPDLEAVQLAGVQRGHELGEGDETVLVAVVLRQDPDQSQTSIVVT